MCLPPRLGIQLQHGPSKRKHQQGADQPPAHPDVDGLAIDVGLGGAAIGAQEPPLAPRLVLHGPGVHHIRPVAGLDGQIVCSACSEVGLAVDTSLGSGSAGTDCGPRRLATLPNTGRLQWQHVAVVGSAPRTPELAVGAALFKANAVYSSGKDPLWLCLRGGACEGVGDGGSSGHRGCKGSEGVPGNKPQAARTGCGPGVSCQLCSCWPGLPRLQGFR